MMNENYMRYLSRDQGYQQDKIRQMKEMKGTIEQSLLTLLGTDLRIICRDNGLHVSGTKDTLANNIKTYIDNLITKSIISTNRDDILNYFNSISKIHDYINNKKVSSTGISVKPPIPKSATSAALLDPVRRNSFSLLPPVSPMPPLVQNLTPEVLALFLNQSNIKQVMSYYDNQFRRNPEMIKAPEYIRGSTLTFSFHVSQNASIAAKSLRKSFLIRCFALQPRSQNSLYLNETWPLQSRLMMNSHVVYDSLAAKAKVPESPCLNITSGITEGENTVEISIDPARWTTTLLNSPRMIGVIVFATENIPTDELIAGIKMTSDISIAACKTRVASILSGNIDNSASSSLRSGFNSSDDLYPISVSDLYSNNNKRYRGWLDDDEEEDEDEDNYYDSSQKTDESCHFTKKRKLESSGGGSHKDEDGDDEIEDVVALTKPSVKLTDPVAMTRIEIPVRGKSCTHLQCFDLRTYIELNKTTKAKARWVCPICSSDGLYLSNLVIDTWFKDILQRSPQSLKSVELLNNGDPVLPNTSNSELLDDDDSDEDDDDYSYNPSSKFSEEVGPVEGARILTAPPPGSSASAPIEID